MLQVLAVLDGDAENLEEAVKRIVHKSHHEPAEQCGQWMVKVFGTRTPKAEALDNAARTIAAEGKTVLLARVGSSGWDEFELRRGQDTLLKMRHPREWIDGCLDATDAWEFCLEEWGDPEDVVTVAGIDPSDKRMQFLWDADEARLVEKNVIPNNEPGFVKALIALAKRKGIELPAAVRNGITKQNTVHGFFVALFDWQLQTFKATLGECEIPFDDENLSRCFGADKWASDWVDSELGSFAAVLGSLGITSLDRAYEDEEFADNLISRLNARKSFKEKDGQVQTPDLWDSLETFNTCEMVFDTTRRLKPLPFGDAPLSITTSEIGYLFMMAWSLDSEIEWLLEVKLPKDRFDLPDVLSSNGGDCIADTVARRRSIGFVTATESCCTSASYRDSSSLIPRVTPSSLRTLIGSTRVTPVRHGCPSMSSFAACLTRPGYHSTPTRRSTPCR